MSLNPFCTNICERVQCILASRCGFTQYWPCQLEVCCSLSAQHATTPCSLSLVCTLSRRVTGTWAFHWAPKKKSTKGSTFRQKSTSLQPLWRLMMLVLVSVGVRNKWPSETHYTSARFGEWSDTAPDYQIHHLYWSWLLFHKCQLENWFHVLYCKKNWRRKDSSKMT